jgi:hypothetical protein
MPHCVTPTQVQKAKAKIFSNTKFKCIGSQTDRGLCDRPIHNKNAVVCMQCQGHAHCRCARFPSYAAAHAAGPWVCQQCQSLPFLAQPVLDPPHISEFSTLPISPNAGNSPTHPASLVRHLPTPPRPLPLPPPSLSHTGAHARPPHLRTPRTPALTAPTPPRETAIDTPTAATPAAVPPAATTPAAAASAWQTYVQANGSYDGTT